MRRYYSARNKSNLIATQELDREVDSWGILNAFIRGISSTIGIDTTATIISIVNTKDVRRLLDFSRVLDGHLIEYDGSTSLALVRAERQLVCLLKKYPFTSKECDLDPQKAAEVNLRAAEDQCRIANERLKNCDLADIPSWVHGARQLIADVLGDLTPSLIMNIINDGTHGPGATLSSQGNRTTPYYKYMDLPYTCTKRALPYAYAAISSQPRWVDLLESKGVRSCIPPLGCPQYQKELTLFDHCVDIVSCDKITFVPKDAQKERPIAIGSDLNMYLQLGVKTYMQERLKRHGVDLSNQTTNQEMAFAGSRYAFCNGVENPLQYSTIDLSNASDTVSIEIVRLLLDPLWFAFLWDLRFDNGDLNGEIISYEKFSAMGNGYTFPLESLIFWSIAKATCQEIKPNISRRDISVYGDDIIVRRWAADAVCASLKWAGFTINEEKSFIAGHFKESCGADYFRGHNVRPFYLKRRIVTYEDAYFVCNSIADIVMRDGASPGSMAIYEYVLLFIPKQKRQVIPVNSTSDFGLRIPLNSVQAFIGSRPFLSQAEFTDLQLNGLISDDERLDERSSYYWQSSYAACSFKGRERTRLMLALRKHKDRDTSFIRDARDLAVYEADSRNIITRRKSVDVVTSVKRCPNWDGCFTKSQLLRHPSNWVKH